MTGSCGVASRYARFMTRPNPEQFVGLSWTEAETLAARQGLVIRDKSQAGFYTDAYLMNRINVWLDQAGIVVRAEVD